LKSEYNNSITLLEKSIDNNKDNIYAYIALGDIFERQKDIKKAIYVYRDLMSLGFKV
jgi:pentatricopeptide repeat protein